jgi:putative phosphoribosyl transferase
MRSGGEIMQTQGESWNPSRGRFRDRTHAGAWLAEHLQNYAGSEPLVFGIPRGGVIVAAEVARRLGAELDTIVARKLGAPGQRELAIGAVTANGGCFLNETLIRDLGVSPSYLYEVTSAEKENARQREERLRGTRPTPNTQNRIVIIVDDGLATGATMLAAARSLRGRHPAKLVAAVPVGARDSCASLQTEVDELVCPFMPEPFHAVGLYYERFDSIEDSEVRQVLDQAREGMASATAARRGHPSPS